MSDFRLNPHKQKTKETTLTKRRLSFTCLINKGTSESIGTLEGGVVSWFLPSINTLGGGTQPHIVDSQITCPLTYQISLFSCRPLSLTRIIAKAFKFTERPRGRALSSATSGTSLPPRRSPAPQRSLQQHLPRTCLHQLIWRLNFSLCHPNLYFLHSSLFALEHRRRAMYAGNPSPWAPPLRKVVSRVKDYQSLTSAQKKVRSVSPP